MRENLTPRLIKRPVLIIAAGRRTSAFLIICFLNNDKRVPLAPKPRRAMEMTMEAK